MATIRGRAGYAWDRFLVYGTGGVAFARVNTHADEYFLGSLIGSDSASATHTGWTLGAGVEAMVTEKVSVKLEYLYADFGKKDYNYDLISGPTGDETIGTADLSVNSIKLGVNFHF
ncbi:MAG: porin family protein [Rhizobiaceae bacterium]|nr:porin family protein [Rhizobiaceae bacterium]